MNKRSRTALILLSVFLISFFGLLLQIGMTRIFSVYLSYHYSFMVVSIALFGWGFGGLLIHFLHDRVNKDELSFMSVLTLILGGSTVLYIILLPFIPQSIVWFYLLPILPFFIAGIGVAFIYSRFAYLSDKLYFSDLCGASLACILFEPMTLVLGIESIVILLGILLFLVCLAISLLLKAKMRAVASITCVIVVSMLLVANVQYSFVRIGPVPGKDLHVQLSKNENLEVVQTRWNSFSRIDVVEGYSDQNRTLATIYIDADASTEVLKWNGSRSDLNDLNVSLDILPYHLVNSNNTLVIGPGGGKDILFALAGGSAKIVGVELNPIIVDVVNKYGSRVGSIYHNQSDIDIIVDEGRSFVRRSNTKYDLISLTLVDTWASVSGGGYALAENYLYTKEAFVDYLNHLSDDGVLMMIRWPSEIPKLVSTAAEAYRSLGVGYDGIGVRMAVVFNDIAPDRAKALFILKKSPFTLSEAKCLYDQVKSFGASYRGFYIPHIEDDVEPYKSFFNGSITANQFYNSFDFMVKPVTDDSPYHFNFEFGIPKTLGALFSLSLLLTCAFIIMPIAVAMIKHRVSDNNRIRKVMYVSILFVSLLGIGYIMIEITMIQKFILFLGYPTRALSVILFSLLLSSGIGSLTSGRFAYNRNRLVYNVIMALLLVVVIMSIYAICLDTMFASLISQGSTVRIAVSVLLLFPLGFFMGIPFPSTLRLIGSSGPSTSNQISWLWGINGAASVLGSIATTIVGITNGYSLAMLLSVCIYGIALLTMLYLKVTKAHDT